MNRTGKNGGDGCFVKLGTVGGYAMHFEFSIRHDLLEGVQKFQDVFAGRGVIKDPIDQSFGGPGVVEKKNGKFSAVHFVYRNVAGIIFERPVEIVVGFDA